MNLDLTSRVAVVAGGSRGIGLAIARTLHREGCSIALVARSENDLQIAAAAMGERVSVHVADVQIASEATRATAEAAARWGKVDILICNVGSGASVAPGTETAAEWQRVLDLNLFSTINMVDAARPFLGKGEAASIVCISSICGLAALGAPVTYSAAKAALNAMVRGLARPLAKDGIRINAVAPGNILFDGGVWDKKMNRDAPAVETMLEREVALNRLGSPQEVADFVTFLASPRASFVTGGIHVADGGQLRA